MLLSIGIMVKNEERYLEQCLKGLQPILNLIESELIIVDTGSDDNTVKIAKKYTDKVYYHEWTNNFSEMRNIVLSYSKGEWFFFLDADEIIEDYTDIIDFFNTQRHKKANSAFFLLKNIISQKNKDTYGYGHALRFFRNDESFRFKGAIHEQPVFKEPTVYIKSSAIHYGYINDEPELMEYKYKRNVDILKKELEKDPQNIYFWFQLSQSYGMYKDNQRSLEAIVKAYELMKAKGKQEYRMFVFTNLAKSYFTNKMYRKAIKICYEGCRFQEGYFDLYYYCGMSNFELSNYKEALPEFKKYLKAVERFKKNEGLTDLSTSYLTVRFYENVLQYICVIYKKLEHYDKALEYANKINNRAVYEEIIPQIVDIYMADSKYSELKGLYEKKVYEEPFFYEHFLLALEHGYKDLNAEQKKAWLSIFKNLNGDYGLLNQVRFIDKTEGVMSEDLISKIKVLNWSELPAFYGDILLSLIKLNISILPFTKSMDEMRLTDYLDYMHKAKNKFGNILLDYIQEKGLFQVEDLSPELLRLSIIIIQSALMYDGLTEEVYKKVFNIYIDGGITHLKNTYNNVVIEHNKTKFMKSASDRFLLCMNKANDFLEHDKAAYVRHLRIALKHDNSMERGIRILQKEISQVLDKPQQPQKEKEELKELKQQLIKTIELSINSTDLETAKKLIGEYKSIVGNDEKICSTEAVVLMIEQRLDEAKAVISEGLELYPQNIDLLYNMGYLSEMTNEASKALKYYLEAKALCKDSSFIKEIDEALLRLWADVNESYSKDNYFV